MTPRDETFVTDTSGHRPTTLADYLAILRRRKWIVITVPVVAALVALQYSSSQSSLYQARAQVLVNRSAGIVTAVTGGQVDPAVYDPTRYLTTQARIARSPTLAARVAAADGVPPVSAGEVLGSSDVSPDAEADLLNISVSRENPDEAVALANAYAHELTRYKTEVDTAQINEALTTLSAREARLRRSGLTDSTAYEKLLEDQTRLQTLGRLLANSTSVLEPATGAAKIQPRPRRAFILAELLGALFALGLVFLAEALDRRVRTEDEITEGLQLPLLGRVSEPPPSLRKSNELVMLAEPMGVHAEAFRKLRGTLEFVNFQHEAGYRTIMFTSAAPREGKSTTIANLAIAVARSGRRVALVDLDLRRPSLHTFLGGSAEPGLTDVAVGREPLARAMRHLSLPTTGGLETKVEGNGRPDVPYHGPDGQPDLEGVLHFLPCGTVPPAAGEFVASERVAALLNDLREAFDVVLVDAPPLTVVGDAMTLSAAVDAIVVVTPFGIERPLLQAVTRELQNCRAAALGFVLTGAPHTGAYAYGYHSYDRDHRRRGRSAGARGRQALFGGWIRKPPREKRKTPHPSAATRGARPRL
jgi:Mrp family chromosome partitioning ATPase